MLSTSYLPALSALGLIVMRSLVSHYVLEDLVRDDRRAYDDAWASFMQGDDDQTVMIAAALHGIGQMCVDASAAIPDSDKAGPRQRYHRARMRSHHHDAAFACGERPSLRRASAGDCGVPGVHGSPIPVFSLDQLYDQAAFLDTFLRDKVVEIGKVSGGLYAVLQRDGEGGSSRLRRYKPFSTLSNTHPNHPLHAEIGWAPLKDPQRALEKLLRCYGGDASRLLDCCRQRIVFARLEDVRAGLQALLADPEIHIVRVRNRLTRSARNGGEPDLRWSGGFRCYLTST